MTCAPSWTATRATSSRCPQVSTATLQLLGRYAPEFPCTLQDLVAFEPNINRVLGAGTDQPGLHIHVNVEHSLGRYTTANAPHYGDNLGPHCYSIPFRGISLNDGAGAATARGGTAGHKPRTTSAFVGPGQRIGAGTGQLAAGERAGQRAGRADVAAGAAIPAGLEQPAGRAAVPGRGGDAAMTSDTQTGRPPGLPGRAAAAPGQHRRAAGQVGHLHRGDGAGHDRCWRSASPTPGSPARSATAPCSPTSPG